MRISLFNPLGELEADHLSDVQYAVLGCGDGNWANTYQNVPRWIDEQFEFKGAARLFHRGEINAGGDFEKSVEEWEENMWKLLFQTFELKLENNTKPVRELGGVDIQYVTDEVIRPFSRNYNVTKAQIVINRELQDTRSDHSTRHIEILLPEGLSYQEGDHIGVLPNNSEKNIERVLQRFHFNGDERLVLKANVSHLAHLPLEHPVQVRELLKHCVELQEAATRTQLRTLVSWTVCPPHKRELEAMIDEDRYLRNILDKRVSMLDLLEQYEACELPFELFIEMLPPLKPRYYSLSSSPKIQINKASLTVAVIDEPAWSGRGHYRGVATNYLAGLNSGDEVQIFIQTPQSEFQLPEDPTMPIVMVGPGTGIAPFRGFLQARAELKKKGISLGDAHLYFGCRNNLDYLYRNELEMYSRDGIVTLHTAFSRKENQPLCYVQHLMEQNAEDLMHLLVSGGGKLYVCGDGSEMAPQVEETIRLAYSQVYKKEKQEAVDWLNRMKVEGRYAKDVW